MAIDRTAAEGFSAGADAYRKARPDYAVEAVDALVDRLGIGPGTRVVDLGAGTGKLTAQLVPTGADLIAIEPVANMRSHLARDLPSVAVLAGTAERVPLANASVDAVVVAQAFHWFDGPAALREFHRILRPGGGLGLVWNARDHTGWAGEVADMVDAYGDAIRRHETEQWKAAFVDGAGFTSLERFEFPNAQDVDREQVLQRVASTSFIATLPEPERDALLSRVRTLLAAHLETRGKERFTYGHTTRIYCCNRS